MIRHRRGSAAFTRTPMQDLGRLMLLGGAALMLGGAVVWLLGHFGFRGLPGDIRSQSDHVRVYFPITSCLVLSLILTAILWLWRWFDSK